MRHRWIRYAAGLASMCLFTLSTGAVAAHADPGPAPNDDSGAITASVLGAVESTTTPCTPGGEDALPPLPVALPSTFDFFQGVKLAGNWVDLESVPPPADGTDPATYTGTVTVTTPGGIPVCVIGDPVANVLGIAGTIGAGAYSGCADPTSPGNCVNGQVKSGAFVLAGNVAAVTLDQQFEVCSGAACPGDPLVAGDAAEADSVALLAITACHTGHELDEIAANGGPGDPETSPVAETLETVAFAPCAPLDPFGPGAFGDHEALGDVNLVDGPLFTSTESSPWNEVAGTPLECITDTLVGEGSAVDVALDSLVTGEGTCP